MARPTSPENVSRASTGIRLPTDLHTRLQVAANDREVSVNWLITRAVEAYLVDLLPVEEMITTRSQLAALECHSLDSGGTPQHAGRAGGHSGATSPNAVHGSSRTRRRAPNEAGTWGVRTRFLGDEPASDAQATSGSLRIHEAPLSQVDTLVGPFVPHENFAISEPLSDPHRPNPLRTHPSHQWVDAVHLGQRAVGCANCGCITGSGDSLNECRRPMDLTVRQLDPSEVLSAPARDVPTALSDEAWARQRGYVYWSPGEHKHHQAAPTIRYPHGVIVIPERFADGDQELFERAGPADGHVPPLFVVQRDHETVMAAIERTLEAIDAEKVERAAVEAHRAAHPEESTDLGGIPL